MSCFIKRYFFYDFIYTSYLCKGIGNLSMALEITWNLWKNRRIKRPFKFLMTTKLHKSLCKYVCTYVHGLQISRYSLFIQIFNTKFGNFSYFKDERKKTVITLSKLLRFFPYICILRTYHHNNYFFFEKN